METVPHSPTEGVYPASDDNVHALEVRGAQRLRGAVDQLPARRRLAEANAKARVAALGGRVVPTTAIVAETLDSSWLVEIEVIAAG
jgi:2-iminobutanoate/2-iminopropanoate deaminase